jgi:hypothetical protein
LSVLIVRDAPGGAQILLDGKDITDDLVGLTIRIELGCTKSSSGAVIRTAPEKKIVVLEYPEPVAIDNPVVEAKFSPDVLSEIEPARRKRGKNATN